MARQRSARVVIGALFGDEGKGKLVDYYAARGADLVVRFNGGAQAAHTVVTPGGRRHVFSHIGSGAFTGAATYLSRYFVLSPLHLRAERQALMALGVKPRIFADPACLVTTPFDVLVNQWAEAARGNDRHGSCGMGFGETIERSQKPRYALTMADLERPDIEDRLREIGRDYLPQRLAELGVAPESRMAGFSIDDLTARFKEDIETFLDAVTPAKLGDIASTRTVMFEGAQGLLLDQDSAYFPHVTRSSTGLTNVVPLAEGLGIRNLQVTYAVRAYATRHGAGPFPRELAAKPFDGIDDPTNVPNKHQGPLRFGWLDLDLAAKAIAHDGDAVGGSVTMNRTIAINCLDQVAGEVTFYAGGRRRHADAARFAALAQARLGAAQCLLGTGPTRADLAALAPRSASAA